jgi:hypothetical protein
VGATPASPWPTARPYKRPDHRKTPDKKIGKGHATHAMCCENVEMSLRALRTICAAIFICGIAGLIISSVAGNNNGIVLTVGLTTAVAAIALLAASSVARREPIDAFEEAEAERLESQVQQLIDAGAPETDVRNLVREAMRLGRRA